MQQDAIDCASQAIDKYPAEKDIASYIKKEFDKKYDPTWHCAVGRNFGSFVTHEAKTMVRHTPRFKHPASFQFV
jgi:dynein light chain LC8-type